MFVHAKTPYSAFPINHGILKKTLDIYLYTVCFTLHDQ